VLALAVFVSEMLAFLVSDGYSKSVRYRAGDLRGIARY